MPGSIRQRIDRHPALPRVVPFALILAGIALDSALAGSAHALPWDLRWDYAARNLCALAALLWLLPELPELRLPAAAAGHAGSAGGGRVALHGYGLALACGVAVLVMWIAPPLRAFAQSAGGFDAHWLDAASWVASDRSTGSGFTPLDASGNLNWGLAAARLAGSTLVVPIAEELFWRSFVMRWLEGPDFLARDPRRVGVRALALQAVLFGLEHELWLAGMLAGLAYGWLYRRTGRLGPPMLAHAVTNGLLGVWVLTYSEWSYW